MAMVSSTVGSPTITVLEAARQGGVLLHVLLVLVEGGGADAAQFAARQRGLQHVGGVDGAFGSARADQRMQLVDEADDFAVANR